MAKKEADRAGILEIDQHNLDKEWLAQPKLYLEWADKLAAAKNEQDEAVRQHKLLAAELEGKIRKNPDDYELGDKPTNPAVEAAIISHKKYKASQENVNAKSHAVALHSAMLNAIEMRRRALGHLVDLYISGYFASPRTNKANRDAEVDMTKNAVRRGKAKPHDDDEDEDDE